MFNIKNIQKSNTDYTHVFFVEKEYRELGWTPKHSISEYINEIKSSGRTRQDRSG